MGVYFKSFHRVFWSLLGFRVLGCRLMALGVRIWGFAVGCHQGWVVSGELCQGV